MRERKTTLDNDKERLHRRKEKKKMEKLFPKEKKRNGEDKLRQHIK